MSVLGPSGTFTDIAARKLYPQADIIYKDSVREVFEFVTKGGVGVVALENSLEGSVGAAMAGLLESDAKIVADTVLDIEHCLLAPKGISKDGITGIMSHSHALAQCMDYLNRNFPKADLTSTASTVAAMDKSLSMPGCAAIGPKEAGLKRGLEVLAQGVQDHESQTRFIAIASEGVSGTKSSIIFAVNDEPGALYSIIRLFADENINLTKIESRPSRRKLGEYVFFTDFENGGMDDDGRDALLAKIIERATFFKDLGSY